MVWVLEILKIDSWKSLQKMERRNQRVPKTIINSLALLKPLPRCQPSSSVINKQYYKDVLSLLGNCKFLSSSIVLWYLVFPFSTVEVCPESYLL